MNDFKQYLQDLADHEDVNSKSFLTPRERILINAGIHLNSIGDSLANPNIEHKKVSISVNKVLFTRTNPEWNKVLIDQCKRSVEVFLKLVERDEQVKKRFAQEASSGKEAILMRGPDEEGYYRVFDGMHRFVGAILEGQEVISAYVPTNEDKHLPICEAHTVYDLIRGYQRHANDENGKVELYHALKLLSRTYENVIGLLKNRFNFSYLPDKEVQEIIQKVVGEK